MIIGIDGNEANVAKRVGISEYAYQLLRKFESFQLPVSRVTFQIYLKDEPHEDLPKAREGWTYRVLKPGKLWTQWRLPLDLFLTKPRPDVFFSATHYAPRFSPVATVVSVMDLSFLYFSDMFNKSDLLQLRNWTAYSVRKAARVLTISNSSRDDIIKEYKVAKEKVVVTHLGIKETVTLEPHIYSMNTLKSKYKVSDNYILFVGTLQPRKNITRLIQAFAKVSKSGKASEDLELVIVGRKGWLYEEIIEAPEKYGVKSKVKFLDNVEDVDLPLFYKNALCFVLPSLYEGFGLPVLEAMQQDCPVITSNISSMPEAGGDAALYVDPEDIDDIAAKVTKLVTSPALRKELKEKGKKQVKKFSWEKTAKETLAVLEQVAQKS
jgi:glycosyltransferase involved in cell wall biosynthesis